MNSSKDSNPASHFIRLPGAQTAPLARRIARSLLILLLVLLIFLGMTPWQQNVKGLGRVIAYIPGDRQQMIAAPVEGRIARWLVKEGSRVKQGELLAELLDNDPQLLQRLAQERQLRSTSVSKLFTPNCEWLSRPDRKL